MSEIIHVKLEYSQALEAKRDILSLELNMINIAKRIRNYQKIREKEMREKNKLKTALAEVKNNIKKIESIWPREHFPELEKFEEKMEQGFAEDKKQARHNADLEIQLKEIQERLRALK